MNLPLLGFAAVWRGLRCPRRLKAFLSESPHFNPRTASLADLREALLKSGDEGEILDESFVDSQENAVRAFSGTLFPNAHRFEEETIWAQQGETLREIGWTQTLVSSLGESSGEGSGAGKKLKTVAGTLTRENWYDRVAGLFTIADPVILHEMLVARGEYLSRLDDGTWMLVLVRSSVHLKENYVVEADFIRWIFAMNGVTVSDLWLLHPNENYQRPGSGGDAAGASDASMPVNPREFFQLTRLNQAVKTQTHPIADRMTGLISRAIAGEKCGDEKNCPFCGKAEPDIYSVKTLHRAGKAPLLLEAEGITDIRNIEAASATARAELKGRHFVQAEAVRTMTPFVDVEAIAAFMDAIEYPVSFVDFESTSEAIPPLPSARVWEQWPFMYSALTVADPEDFSRLEAMQAHVFLMKPDADRAAQTGALVESLVDELSGARTIVAYGAALERATFLQLARFDPSHAEALEAMRARVLDLQTPFGQFWYYHPRQMGRLSLKKLLPILSPLSYDSLALRSGGKAHVNYFFLSHPEARNGASSLLAEPEAVTRSLIQYSSLDALGLAHVFKALLEMSGR